MLRSKARRLALVAAAGVLLAQGAAMAADPLRITKPIQATKDDLDPQRTWAAPYLLVHPDDPKVIVGGIMEFRTKQCGLMRSTDGGATWRILDATAQLASYPYCLANNSNIFQAPMAWGRDNTLYQASVAWDTPDTRSKSSISLSRSTNLGDSWTTTLVRDARPTADQKQESNRPVTGVVVDSRSGSQDIVYVTYRRGLQNQPTGSSAPSHAMIAVSRDGGKTFGEPVFAIGNYFEDAGVRQKAITTATSIPGTTTTTAPAGSLATTPDVAANFGSGNNGLAVDDDGNAYVAWPSSVSNQVGRSVASGIFISKSTDQGRTWAVNEVHGFDHAMRGNVQLAWGKGGGSSGTLHLVYENRQDPALNAYSDVWYQRSTDGGRTWSTAKSITDDNKANLAGKYIPYIRTAPNGRVDVVWWDTRDDPGIRANDVYYAYSNDNGQTWSKNIRVTDQTIDRRFGVWGINYDQNSPPSLASIDEFAVIAWDDTRLSRGLDGPVLPGDPTSQAGVGSGVQDIFITTAQFQELGGGGASSTAQVVMAAVVGILAVGLILLVVALLSRRRTGPPATGKKAEGKAAAGVG